MKPLLLALFVSSLLAAAEPTVSFTKSFPGSTPAFCSVEVEKTGVMRYKESPTEEPLQAQMRDLDAAALFAMAEKLDYFKTPLESGLKVANTGKKTFRYEDGNGVPSEVVFNYSLNETAKQLLDRFEQIAATERAYIDLDKTIHFDKLGVNDSLAQVEALWLRKELVAPRQFLPLLTRIAAHDSFMHLVRDRAARLKDEFMAPPAADGQK
jgi:hypothetical protein